MNYSVPLATGHSSSLLDLSTNPDDWILLDGSKVSFMRLSNLSSNSKKDLCRKLGGANGQQDVYVLGVSYSDAQSLSGCRDYPKANCHTLPRCRSYRLRKTQLMAEPFDTLSSITSRANNESRTLYFSRHGESEYNVLGKVGGDADLSPRGYQYADSLAEYVNGTLGNTPGFKLWTSCLKRTIQTAKNIEAPREHLDALNELDTGVCDGLTYEEIAERYPIEFAARDDDKFHYRYPEGESYFDLLLRVKPVLDRLKVENNVLVIAHQAVLRCLLAALLKKDEKELPYIHTPLHTVMRLSFKPADGGCHLDLIPLSIECVETHRAKPENCSLTRTAEEACVTVPAHF
ncbi:6-phosphofructo-2-kinase/fructose-2,6-bisphosphatase 1-like isoform X2 [Daphnia pulex]|nr:6-phosphofructo-2-kinase/fructose-2,6-bisphosphatase 1-like isoform X2 [Daphnia pulex]XP_046463690.1 6-phosphofructo-2-kinase/fructose-2,6-bisphosphatase 1-like isoform X2 [Daphnia pulex]